MAGVRMVNDIPIQFFGGINGIKFLSCISCQKTCWFRILRVRGLACGPQGHTSVLEYDDGNSTNMTGKLTSFANHACCRKFRMETESKGGQ
jgi:hypothetical protein